MPFTPSHVAAVLPALRPARTGVVRARGPLCAAGLVAGSMAPDVPFFADSLLPGCHGLGRVTHSTAGVLLADPLLAAALVAGWTAVRGPVTALLPPGARTPAARLLYGPERPGRLPAGAREAVAAAGWFWASAALGAATHVVGDAFTHEGRWGVRTLPVLERRVAGVPLHHWAQYASSAAGLAVTGVWLRNALRGPAAGPGGADGPLRAPVHVPRFVSSGLTTRQRVTGAVLLGGTMVAGSVARCRRDRPSALSGLIAAASFGAGGWAAPAALGWALLARRAAARNRSRVTG